MEPVSENEHEEDDATKDSNDFLFTIPLGNAKPIYSRIWRSAKTRSTRRTPLKPLKPFPNDKEDLADAGYLSGQSSVSTEERSTSGNFVYLDNSGGVTSIRNDIQGERNILAQDENKVNSKVSTPLPLKSRTPFSAKSTVSLVKRVPSGHLTPYLRKADESCILPNAENKELVESHINGKKYGSQTHWMDNKHARVLKDILNQNHNIKRPECDKLSIDVLSGIFDIKGLGMKNLYSNEAEENVSYLKSLKNEAITPPNLNDKIQEDSGNQFHDVKDKNAPQKTKSLRPVLSAKEEASHIDTLNNFSLCHRMESKVISVNNIHYIVLSKLGQGGSSQVFQVLDRKYVHLAVKCVNLIDADEATASGYLKEIDILSNLQESNRVIKLIDHEYNTKQQMLYVVMEKGETDLSNLLKQMSKTGDVSLFMIIYYWTEMLQAVKEIHAYGIVHADLKPANFLLVCGRLKLIDFGIASAIQNDATSVYKNSMHGTCNYMSPEAIQDPGDSSRTKVGYKSDVWSLGCILYNLLYRKTPFQHITNSMQKLQMIVNPNHHIDFPPLKKCTPSLMKALKSCLNYDAKKRPSVDDLLSLDYGCTHG